MNNAQDARLSVTSPGERGASRLSLLIFLLLVGAVDYAAHQYVPVAYQASLYKVDIQDTVDKAVATGQGAAWVETQLKSVSADYHVPANALYKVELRDGRVQANARWVRLISLPGYTYQYSFDHTVKSANFLTPK